MIRVGILACFLLGSVADAQTNGQFWWLNLDTAPPMPGNGVKVKNSRSFQDIFKSDITEKVETSTSATALDDLLNAVWPAQYKPNEIESSIIKLQSKVEDFAPFSGGSTKPPGQYIGFPTQNPNPTTEDENAGRIVFENSDYVDFLNPYNYEIGGKKNDFAEAKTPTVQPKTSTTKFDANDEQIFFDCGRKASSRIPADRTFGEVQSWQYDSPWTLMLLLKSVQDTYFFGRSVEEEEPICGASLLHPRAALTAYHCISGKKAHQLKIRAGEYDYNHKNDNDILPHQERDIDNIVKRKDYYSGGFRNDIAILIWTSPLTITDHIRPICLPTNNLNFIGRTCQASGWGSDVEQSSVRQTTLREVSLEVVDPKICEDRLRTTKLGMRFRLHSSFLCAGGGKYLADTCKGDGGGPLVCQVGERFYQIGITSWGIGCDGLVPAAYTNVTKFTKWIMSELNNVVYLE